jgi:hypothetical protein
MGQRERQGNREARNVVAEMNIRELQSLRPGDSVIGHFFGDCESEYPIVGVRPVADSMARQVCIQFSEFTRLVCPIRAGGGEIRGARHRE